MVTELIRAANHFTGSFHKESIKVEYLFTGGTIDGDFLTEDM